MKLELFLKKKRDCLLLGLWFANLYLFTRTFGDYFGSQFDTCIAVLGAIGIYNKKWLYYWISKYGAKRMFCIIAGFTVLHMAISIYIVKPLKAVNAQK